MIRRLHATALSAVVLAATLPAAPQIVGDTVPAVAQAPNPYGLKPFHQDFPVDLSFPTVRGATYDRTRRQALERLAANLQGNVRREAWQFACGFFDHAPEDAAEPLMAAMDAAFGSPALNDAVKNCVEAMARMADPRFENALLRAVEHKAPVVRQAAFAALAVCGSDATLRRMAAWFPNMDARARTAWLGAVRTRLGDDAVAFLRDVFAADYGVKVRDEVVQEALRMPPAQAAAVLAVRWEKSQGDTKALIAGVLHAAGDARGTTWLREAMAGEDLAVMMLAIRHSGYGEPGELRNILVRATAHLRPDVRLEAAKILRGVPGDDVADAFEVLAAPDEVWEVKVLALRELTRRGRGKVVGALLEDLPTATGTRLQLLLRQLAESGDPRAVPILVQRCEKAPPEEKRPFLQALAQNGSEAAIDAMLAIFVGQEQIVARAPDRVFTTRGYLPTLLCNSRGHEERVIAAFERLPREDWRLRGPLLTTVVGLATDAGKPEIRERCLECARRVLFEPGEAPQMRVLALNLLSTRWLRIEDAMRLKNLPEDGPMRLLFHDFLLDFF